MDQLEIIEYVVYTFDGVDVVAPTEGFGAGDTFLIYDPNRDLPERQRFPFATIVSKDYGEFDNLSNLNRPDVYRLNIGVSRETFQSLFGPQPTAGTTLAGHDYAAFDTLIPHPIYAPQSWVSVLNPSHETFERVKPLLAEAYQIAVDRQTRHRPTDS